ncbi:MAG TPA: DNRLRE domain-containing protein [Bacteroidales bacterium]|nr:DNRLRE domain-containing protein [Bacteroidales bacterium]
MKNWLLGGIFIYAMVINLFTTSCSKEASSVLSDTVTVARIYQCDPALGKEAVIQSIVPDTNFGDSTVFSIFSWTNDGLFNISRALIVFDLSAIPSQTVIKKATLSLYWVKYMNLTSQTGDNAFSILKVTENWNEHTITWNNQPDTSSQNKVMVPKSTGETQSYVDVDVTPMVQEMINHPAENFGFMLKLEDEFPYKLVVLASSDYPESKKRPKLIVYF